MEESIPAIYYSSVIEENKEKMFGGTGGDIQILSYPHLILFRVYTRMLCSDGRSWRFGWSQTVDLKCLNLSHGQWETTEAFKISGEHNGNVFVEKLIQFHCLE